MNKKISEKLEDLERVLVYEYRLHTSECDKIEELRQLIKAEDKKILDKIDSKIHDVEFLDNSMSKLYWKADLEEIKQLIKAKS